jgi:tetratricopeptide (TPR) repeat protein
MVTSYLKEARSREDMKKSKSEDAEDVILWGDELSKTQQYGEAIVVYSALLKRSPHNMRVKRCLADLYFASGANAQRAIDCYEDAASAR